MRNLALHTLNLLSETRSRKLSPALTQELTDTSRRKEQGIHNFLPYSPNQVLSITLDGA